MAISIPTREYSQRCITIIIMMIPGQWILFCMMESQSIKKQLNLESRLEMFKMIPLSIKPTGDDILSIQLSNLLSQGLGQLMIR